MSWTDTRWYEEWAHKPPNGHPSCRFLPLVVATWNRVVCPPFCLCCEIAISYIKITFIEFPRMPNYCVVPQCNRYNGHHFPKAGPLRKKWLVAIRRDKWKPGEHSIVCHSHFREDDYVSSSSLFGKIANLLCSLWIVFATKCILHYK